MKRHQQPVDLRPFQSKADQAREQMLEAQHRRLAIPVVVAAVQHCAGHPAKAPADDKQKMH